MQLTVNLPKLEYYNAVLPLSDDELEHASGDSEKWTSPSVSSPPTTILRDRGISPISESTEPRMSWTLDLSAELDERLSRSRGTSVSPTGLLSPTITIMDEYFPGNYELIPFMCLLNKPFVLITFA